MRYRAIKELPKVKLDVCAVTRDGRETNFLGVDTYPRKAIRDRDLIVKYTLYYVSLRDILAAHSKSHPAKVPDTDIDLSCDGVPESKSSGLSLDILSVRFKSCNNIYSVAILQPAKKGLKMKDEIVLKHFLEEIPSTPLTVKLVIADAPKRASLQGLKSHAANFGCPYCYAKKVDGKFPASTFRSGERTNRDLRRTADALAAGIELVDNGVKTRSPLAELPGLDLINDVPAEAMHLIHLGVVRKMVTMMYKSRTGKHFSTRIQGANDEPFNAMMRDMRALSDFSRRPRDLDVAVWKAEEYRNLVLAYWPVVMRTAPRECLKVWLLTVYVVRGASLSDNLYNQLNTEEFENVTMEDWYKLYERTFGVKACSYNPHVFSHLNVIRKIAPLADTSARRYEDHYAVMKKNYNAGSTSQGTQTLQSTMLSQMAGHSCRRARSLTLISTKKTEDRYVYLADKRIYLLTNLDEIPIRGRRVPAHRTPGLLPGLDFCDVLVFRLETNRISPDEECLAASEVLGKVVVAGEYGSVILWEMLEV